MEPAQRSSELISGTYKILRKLGEGAFGQIFIGLNVKTQVEVAVKKQPLSSTRRQLEIESRMITLLCQGNQDIAIPKLHCYESEDNYNVMVLELLGPSLEDLFNLCEKRFSVKTTLMVGMQMLQLIRYVHSRETLHRDIKPDNFLIGCRSNSKRVYMIDFGLSRKYRSNKGQHTVYRDNKTLTGTARYVSINTHIGIEQSRRDDLESFVYVLIYFLKGSLPWQNLKALDKRQKYERIMQRKLSIPIHVLCGGLPPQIQDMLTYVRSLQFQQEPNYDMLMDQLKTVGCQLNLNLYDGQFDWLEVVSQKRQKITDKQPTNKPLREMLMETA